MIRAISNLAGLCAALLAAPVTAGPEADFSVPPYDGAYQPRGEDERGIWMIADEGERRLRDSRMVIGDPQLNTYVRDVLCRTVGENRCGSVRIYILRSPIVNASMTPNGTMRIYSGFLLRMKNEAELAALLGHEFAHFELRHTLADFKRHRTGGDLIAWTALIAGIAQTYGGGSAITSVQDMQTSVYGSLAKFSRDQERDADIRGFAYMATAKYRPSAAADLWRSAMNESDHTAAGRYQRSARYDGVAFMATHPTNLQRADYLSALANRVPGGEFDGMAQYASALGPWRRAFLEDQLKLNDFGGTEYLLERLAGDAWTADLLFARGELYRRRGNPRDLVHAAGFYRNALAGDPSLADAHYGLGLSLLRSGSREEGKSELATYLMARPDAPDAAMLRSLIQQ